MLLPNDPAGQVMQADAPALEYVPIGQSKHTVEFDAVAITEYFPLMHWVQIDDLILSAKVPAGQGKQLA